MSKLNGNKKQYQTPLEMEVGGQWTAFDQKSGQTIESFLKAKLEDAVVDFDYRPTGFTDPNSGEPITNALIGKNAFGKVVCWKEVINAEIQYDGNITIKQISVGTVNYTNPESATNPPVQINKIDDLSVLATLDFNVVGSIAGTTFDEIGPRKITFRFYKDADGIEVNPLIPSFSIEASPGENITLPISELFKYAFSNMYLFAELELPNNAVKKTCFKQMLTLRSLNLSYSGGNLLRTNIITGFKLEGTDGESLDNYKLQYYIDGKTSVDYPLAGKSATSDGISLELASLEEGSHDLCVRAVSGGALTSNYVNISFIYQKQSDSIFDEQIRASAVVCNIPTQVSNCDLATFFQVVTTDCVPGDVEIIVLKSSSLSNISSIQTLDAARQSSYKFKEVNLSLLNTDTSKPIDYTSYIEVDTDSTVTEYLKVFINDGLGFRAQGSYVLQAGNPTLQRFQTISINSPAEGSEQYRYTKGAILNFSQISNGDVFTNLNPILDSSNGIQLEQITENNISTTMTTFKASPTTGIFATPKKLLSSGQTSLHRGAFSIEMMIKTYGVNDLEDKILTIGNITLCPKHLFINYEPNENTKPHHTVNASRADFRKDVIQHILITYDPNYKPSTYDNLYNKLYSAGSVSYKQNALAYPCFKVYVNGTINRIISVNPDVISPGDLNFQIHPSNSNVNIYIFRTYDKALNYEEVRKNYTSSKLKYQEKSDYYKENDILYLSSDFAPNVLDSKRSIINTISLGKCINKFKSIGHPNTLYKDRRVLLVALPEGVLPPYYGNRENKEPKAAFLVHYPEILSEEGAIPSQYSGVLNGGKVKPQGSSAKKYTIHNTSYSKFTFTPESEFKKENTEDRITYNHYKMPGSDIPIKKLVGKVNYASSMQSHKQGSIKLFHDGYVNSGHDTSWMNGGRKAVLEDDFLYFFVNVPEGDLETISWDYFKQEDGTYNFENCYFLGFQTWGSAKGDEPTSGYSDATPHYLMLEGADNDNSAANFKTPWASMQIWGNYQGSNKWSNADSTFIEQPSDTPTEGKNYYHQFSGGTKNTITGLWTPNYLEGLLIKDETLVFDPGIETENTSDKKADAWDVDFGCEEGTGYYEKGDGPDPTKENLFFTFKEKTIKSLNIFAQFYNLVYTFDFSSLVYIEDGTTINGNDFSNDGLTSYQYKLVFGSGCTIEYDDNTTINPAPGDVYRWEKAWNTDTVKDSVSKWVPAGLYYDGDEWTKLNIVDLCNQYSNAAQNTGTYPAEYAFFAKAEYEQYKAKTITNTYKYILPGQYTFMGNESGEGVLESMQACMAEAFKIVIREFTDVDDIAYHQAFIKLVAGTDNRAKNTYFQIIGDIYTDKANTSAGEVSIVKTKIKIDEEQTKDIFGYVVEGQLQEVTIEGEEITETENLYALTGTEEFKPVYYKKSGKGDFKIRLYQDDLDTIFKTDNNGQQIKPYYLLEPPYNKDLEYLWGDLHSGMFYNFDLTFIPEITSELTKLLTFATGNQWPDSEGSKFNEYYLSIQKAIPSIAYNHQSEIYYESSQPLWQKGEATQFYLGLSNADSTNWIDYNNNKVKDPVSLSHGSCLEAEVEYLRDRVLLLSTYVNAAKNKTDVSIKIDGGSDTSLGDTIDINTEYTSFIQYIYPTIYNTHAKKDSTSLNFDPLLNYMQLNQSGDYEKVGLVYDIALPNENINISQSIPKSMTLEAFWTSTDLYKTIHITKGVNAFSSLFTFPKASTVISQDPSYAISPIGGGEIKVVDHLESVEHLVLQNAKITAKGLDFTGCNRLKTLVLGKTENNLTDSPEDVDDKNWYATEFVDVLDPTKTIQLQAGEASTGISQLILPKSNSVEQLVLPNSIKVLHLNYYPNLYRLQFDPGTNFTNITVDGRNEHWVLEYLISNFVTQTTEVLEITNVPDDLWLSEISCRKLASIPNVRIQGKVNIGDTKTLTTIDWSTKKLLVEKFGDIENGNTIFNYQKVSFNGNNIAVSQAGSIESSGLAPISISIDGNDVPIATDKKHLRITYKITSRQGINDSDVKILDQYSPMLTITEGVEGTINVQTTIYYTTSKYATFDTTITIGFYAPKPGDFAYANGTFNSAFDSNLGLVGVVFYSKEVQTADETTYDVRVLSAEFSSENLPLSPAKYAVGNSNYYGSLATSQAKYESFMVDLGLSSDVYYTDVDGGNRTDVANGTINYNAAINGTPLDLMQLSNTSEHEYQLEYIRRAQEFISKIKNDSNNKNIISVSSLESSDFQKPTAEGKVLFDKVLQEFSTITKIDDVGSTTNDYTSQECGGSFTYALYPAFLKALYFTPSVVFEEKGEKYFGVGNWYIPDSKELERIIYYRINSAITNTTNTYEAWNATSYVNNDATGRGLNIFKQDAFTNIKFLNYTGYVMSSEVTGESNGQGLLYGYLNYTSEPPQWISYSSYGGQGRDFNHKIAPVCRVVLTKSHKS